MSKRENGAANKSENKMKYLLMFGLILVLSLGVILSGLIVRNHSGMAERTEETSAVKSGSIAMTEIGENGISLTYAKTPIEAYASEISETGQTKVVTATAYPDNDGEDTRMKWEAKWQNEASEWATGKEVGEYLTLSFGDTTKTSKICEVTCLQAFGEPVVVTVSLIDKPSINAEILVDYAARIEDVSLRFGEISCVWGGETEITLELSEDGEPTGGKPELELLGSDVYTIPISEATVSYTLSKIGSVPYFVQGSGNYGMNIVGFYVDQSPSEPIDYDLTKYDVAKNGLYFGAKFLHDNMSFNSFSVWSGYSLGEFSGLKSSVRMAFDQDVSGSYTKWTINDLLFRLKVTVDFCGQKIEKVTDFKVTGYTDHSSVSSVETDQSNLIF